MVLLSSCDARTSASNLPHRRVGRPAAGVILGTVAAVLVTIAPRIAADHGGPNRRRNHHGAVSAPLDSDAPRRRHPD
ncbi:hypothetical protein [Rhodococcus sp. T2V]|uniref:hypothetical protein n=1 Tax=Rhodococcus sp. T2V TaxID=3034164 RepID=UPI0023E0BB00|nr:hypothetical protein [Rhodococcus sp. T2V]